MYNAGLQGDKFSKYLVYATLSVHDNNGRYKDTNIADLDTVR